MFSYSNLYDRVFNKDIDADKLIIITGYIGTSIITDLNELPYSTDIYIGMYGSNIGGIIHNSLLKLNNEKKININYTNILIHSKCYIWLKNGKVIKALIGSANFSTSALMTPKKEVLGDIPLDSYNQIQTYMNLVIEDSYPVNEYTGIIGNNHYVDEYTKSINDIEVEISLLASRNGSSNILGLETIAGEVHMCGGLNWGFSDAQPLPNDAYIPIPSDLIRNNPLLFPPKNEEGNEYVDAVWDDGTQMQLLLEGTQIIDNIKYPKQIASFKNKKVLGIYLRKRIGKKIGEDLVLTELTKEDLVKNVSRNPQIYIKKIITKQMLDKYGRNSINIKLLGEASYYLDFSSKEEEKNE